MTAEPEYLMVKDWREHQHYKDRNPPWIKLYKRLLDDPEFAALPDISKGHLMLIWVLASVLHNRIPNRPQWVAGKIGANEPVDLALLVSAGYLTAYQDASNTLAGCKQSAVPREHIDHIKQSSENRVAERTRSTIDFDYELDGNRNLTPVRSIASSMASLGDTVARQQLEEDGDVAQFLNGFFPPTRLGSGVNRVVVEWVGRIPDHQLRAAVRRIQNEFYPNDDGESVPWSQLSEERCRRVILAVLNPMAREFARN